MLTQIKGTYTFWEFYEQNKEDVDRIIWNACWKNKDRVDPNDMYSEIILRLHRSKFHEQYNPKKKTAFSSYFIMKVNRYAYHVVEFYERRQIIDCMSVHKNQKYSGRVFFKEMNGNATDSIESLKELCVEDEVEEKAIFNETVRLTKMVLRQKELSTFDLLQEEYEIKTIAEKLNCSYQFVVQLKDKIAKKLAKNMNKGKENVRK